MLHFIGIKGSGMSALAQIMHALGYQVQGSDVAKEFFTEIELRAKNIPVLVYNEDNIIPGLEIVQGNSVKDDHEEIIKAKRLGLKIYSYQEMIGKLIKNFNTIAVTGCHGKTTTTAMLAHVLNNIQGCNYLIGDGTGHAQKENPYFALEACEYQRHFLAYYPNYIIITNIELDHVDYYKNIDDVVSAYQEFTSQAKSGVVAYGDDEYIRKLKTNNILYYGLRDDNDIIAKDVIYNNQGTEFDVYIKGNLYAHFALPFFGEHLILNSLAVITICYLENINVNRVVEYLKTFPGAKRRFAEKNIKGTIIIDDYAHHPTEIKATIKAAKQKYPDRKLIAIFQPHTFTRTKEFIKEYIEVLSKADHAFLLDLHPAREKQEDYPGISSQLIIDGLKNGEHINMNEAKKLLPYKGAVVIFMGANDLTGLESGFQELINRK